MHAGNGNSRVPRFFCPPGRRPAIGAARLRGGVRHADGQNRPDGHAGDASANLSSGNCTPRDFRHERRANLHTDIDAHGPKGRVDAYVPRQCICSRSAAIEPARRGQVLLDQLADAHGSAGVEKWDFHGPCHAEPRTRDHNQPALSIIVPARRDGFWCSHRGRPAPSQFLHGIGCAL